MTDKEDYHDQSITIDIYELAKGAVFIGSIFIIISLSIINNDSSLYLVTFLAGLATILTGASILLFLFLQKGNYIKVENFKKLKKDQGSQQTLSKGITEKIDEKIQVLLNDDFLFERFKDHYSDKFIEETNLNNIYDELDSLDFRIENELSRLRRSASVNLVIGTCTSALAVMALLYEVFSDEIDFKDTTDILSHYIPRLSVVIFIEIFAFFFLRLYKTNLNEIKYFSNEKTNAQYKAIALKIGLLRKDKSLIEFVVKEFTKTERNFKLQKGESTVEIEKNRLEAEQNKSITDLLSEITKKNN